jgi:hypothetical protein
VSAKKAKSRVSELSPSIVKETGKNVWTPSRLLVNVSTLKFLKHRGDPLRDKQCGEMPASQGLPDLELRAEFSKPEQICHSLEAAAAVAA